MADSVTMKLDGAAEALRMLRTLPDELQAKHLQGAVDAGGRPIVAEAKARAPFDTGRLQENIIMTRGKKSDTDAAVLIRVRAVTARMAARFRSKTGLPSRMNPKDAFYWRFLEFGTSKMAARPFLRPAFDSKKEQAVSAVVMALRDGVERTWRRLMRK